jgi:hypothetical protein
MNDASLARLVVFIPLPICYLLIHPDGALSVFARRERAVLPFGNIRPSGVKKLGTIDLFCHPTFSFIDFF